METVDYLNYVVDNVGDVGTRRRIFKRMAECRMGLVDPYYRKDQWLDFFTNNFNSWLKGGWKRETYTGKIDSGEYEKIVILVYLTKL